MEMIALAPLILVVSFVGEYLKLTLANTELDRQAIFAREQKNCLLSYVIAAAALVYVLATGKSIALPLILALWTVGAHIAARLWSEKA